MKPLPTDDGSDAAARIASLETDFRSIHEDVKGLARAVESLGGETRSAINALGHQISKSRETPWSLIIGCFAILIPVVGGAGAWISQNIGRVEEQNKWQDTQLRADALNIAANTERLQPIDKHLDQLDKRLQRVVLR